jgi:hypothetical protein
MDDSPGNLRNSSDVYRRVLFIFAKLKMFRWQTTYFNGTVINPFSRICYVFFCCLQNKQNKRWAG